MNDAQRLDAAFAIVDGLRQQLREQRARRQRYRSMLRFAGVGVGGLAVWIVFTNWIL